MEHPAFTLAALCSIGGIAGYARRKSVPSLIGGVGVGILFGISGYLLKQNKEYGIHTALAASLLLIGASAPRAIRLRKAVPVGLTILGLTASAYYGKKYSDFYL
ncbi:transmembrane proteins 14C-domain-containing protein [Lipomyces chichibuensis]|uniref:transmembrane proteins 14C-domain-containing protein n=1 Tax=Lipomyces chichibuensis TaxID=1546026 RepID=UPI003342FD31